jgi:hypothetical protein
MKQISEPRPRTIIDGNIVTIGNKNFTMEVSGEDITLIPCRNQNEKYVMTPEPGNDTGVYEIVHSESQCSLWNLNSRKVRVILLGNMFLEVTETLEQTI